MGMVYPGGGGLKKLIEAGYVTEAPTLSELARKIGVDPAGLERTVAKMNQYSALGVDPEFGKGNEEIDREIGDPKHKHYPCLGPETGRAHVCTPGSNANFVRRLLIEKKRPSRQ